MIGYIKGTVEDIGIDYVLIENNEIGYKLNASSNTLSQLSEGDRTKMYTKMIVREDDISLCGFYSKEELDMFNLLTSVSKIGTKLGLAILSFATPSQIHLYISTSDTKTLSKAPGVGKKTAERMVLELKDKLGKLNISGEDLGGKPAMSIPTTSDGEAIDALVALGYTGQESKVAVDFVKQPGMGVEDKVKKALEYILKTNFKF